MNKLGLLTGAVVVAGLGIFVWQATRPSPELTPQSGGHVPAPDTSAIAEGAPIVQVSTPETLSPDEQIGQRAFNAVCSACHGKNAAGQNGVAPPLVFKTYEPGHHPDEAFQRAAKNGVQAHHWKFGNMPPIEGLTRADVQYITQYVRALQRANGIN